MFYLLGSANVERSFSILNHIRSSRRHSLIPDTLKKLLFIRNNAPKDVTKFDGIIYAVY